MTNDVLIVEVNIVTVMYVLSLLLCFRCNQILNRDRREHEKNHIAIGFIIFLTVLTSIFEMIWIMKICGVPV